MPLLAAAITTVNTTKTSLSQQFPALTSQLTWRQTSSVTSLLSLFCYTNTAKVSCKCKKHTICKRLLMAEPGGMWRRTGVREEHWGAKVASTTWIAETSVHTKVGVSTGLSCYHLQPIFNSTFTILLSQPPWDPPPTQRGVGGWSDVSWDQAFRGETKLCVHHNPSVIHVVVYYNPGGLHKLSIYCVWSISLRCPRSGSFKCIIWKYFRDSRSFLCLFFKILFAFQNKHVYLNAFLGWNDVQAWGGHRKLAEITEGCNLIWGSRREANQSRRTRTQV